MSDQKILTCFCFLQWKLHLFELEGELKIDPPIKYVLYEVCTMFSFSSSSILCFSPQGGVGLLSCAFIGFVYLVQWSS